MLPCFCPSTFGSNKRHHLPKLSFCCLLVQDICLLKSSLPPRIIILQHKRHKQQGHRVLKEHIYLLLNQNILLLEHKRSIKILLPFFLRNSGIGSDVGNNANKAIHSVHHDISFTVILLWEDSNTINYFYGERNQSRLKYYVGVCGLENSNKHQWPNTKIKTSPSIWAIQVKCMTNPAELVQNQHLHHSLQKEVW